MGGDGASGQRPGPGQARACVSSGGGGPDLDPDTAAEELPALAGLYAPSPGRCVAPAGAYLNAVLVYTGCAK